MFSRQTSKTQELASDNFAARESIHEIRRVSEASLFGANVDAENSFRLIYLREQFIVNDLEALFNRYTERINQAYFSLFLLLQTCLSLTQFILVLVLNVEANTLDIVILDLILYSLLWISSIILLFLNEKYGRKNSKIFKIASISIILFVFLVDLIIPIYYYLNITYNLRPASITHVIISCYIFSSITSNWITFFIGIGTTTIYLLTLGFVTYADQDYLWTRLGTDLIYLLCLNGIGLYFRFTNEVMQRKSFLDHRGCVESTLRLKFEKRQEEQLMKSIIPEHAIEGVRRDILNKINYMVKYIKFPTTDPMDVPYVEEHDNVSILYADIVNYTSMTSKLPVKLLVEALNDLFSGFDTASEQLNVLRIKFLGDCYYCVAGLPPNPAPNHGEACVDLGLQMISIIRKVRENRNLDIDMRIGIHSGKIISGIIGSAKWQFDIWSKDVLLANIMETTGDPGKVHITGDTHKLVTKLYNIELTDRGTTEPKLQPYNVITYLISPNLPEESKTSHVLKQSNGIVREKRLSKIGEIDLPSEALEDLVSEDQEEDDDNLNNQYFNNVDATVVDNSSANHNDDPVISGHYARRGSVLSQGAPIGTILQRRLSGHQIYTGKRFSYGNYIPRRTAFMDNNIHRYKERLQETDENIKAAIEEMPLTKFEQWIKVKEINPFLLAFKNLKMEIEFNKLLDPLYRYYVIAYAVLLTAVIVIQNLTLPQWRYKMWLKYGTLAFMLLILIPLSWMYYLWNRFVAPKRIDGSLTPRNNILKFLYNVSCKITQHFLIRTVLYFLICSLFFFCIFEQLVNCKSGGNTKAISYSLQSLLSVLLRNSNENELEEECKIPWHMSYTLSLAILAEFSFLRIHIWIKLFLASGITIFYAITVWTFSSEFYEHSESFNYMMKPQIAHILNLTFLTFTLHLIDRQADYLNRLDYQWNETLVSEQQEVNTMHKITKMLLINILPAHVAELYLDLNRDSQEVYTEENKNVSVIFATVLDYPIESMTAKFFLSFMNLIIKDFDQLLRKDRRTPIEKIKVNNLTYMAACGLDYRRRDSAVKGYVNKSNEHVAVTMLKFAVDMIKTIKKFNASLLDCKLRIGISHGEVLAGVVGSKKPLYDIWGDTVNLASRMDSTGVPGKIQVPEATAAILQNMGIKCSYRDIIYVKGKGNIPTYFVCLDENDDLILNE